MKSKLLMAALAGVMLLGACKGSGSGYDDEKASTADSLSASKIDTSGSKLVKTADMRFKVKNVQQTGDAIAALTVKSGGMVMSHHMEANVSNTQDIRLNNDSIKRVSAFTSTADITIKVPSNKLEDVITQIGHMAIYVDIQKMDIEDKALDQLSAKLKLQNRKKQVDKEDRAADGFRNPGNVKQLKDDMVDQKIANMKTDAAVKYSTITLSFYQSNGVTQEVIANDDPSAYQQPFFNRLWISLTSGWNVFVNLLLVIANLWIFIVLAAGLWMLYRYCKKKHPTWFMPTIKS